MKRIYSGHERFALTEQKEIFLHINILYNTVKLRFSYL